MFQKQRRVKNPKGFSLLEVLFSILILSFSLSAIGYLTYSGMIANTRSILQNEGLWHAQTLVEEFAAGIRDCDDDRVQSITHDPNWRFRVRKQPVDIPQVENLEVTVWKEGRWRTASEVKLDRMIYSGGNPR